jgi:hypothetical protein
MVLPSGSAATTSAPWSMIVGRLRPNVFDMKISGQV